MFERTKMFEKIINRTYKDSFSSIKTSFYYVVSYGRVGEFHMFSDDNSNACLVM